MPSRSKQAWILLVPLALLVGLGVWFSGHERTPRAIDVQPAKIAREPVRVGAENSLESSPTGREAVAPERATNADAPPAPTATQPADRTLVHGRVLALDGTPIANQEVRMADVDRTILARSRGDGSFECEVPIGDGALVASSAAFESVRGIQLPVRTDRPFIVVAPVVPVAGVVVGEDGIGIAGAMVSIQFDEASYAQFPEPLDATQRLSLPSVTSDAGGAFSMPHAVSAFGARLWAQDKDHVPASREMPETTRSDIRFVLKRSASLDVRMLRGIVVRAQGEPATTAEVRLGDARTDTDAKGAFELMLPKRVQKDTPLVATEPGSQGAFIPDFGRIVRDSKGDPDPVHLVLGPPPLSIRGHILDAGRRPLANWTVRLADATAIDHEMAAGTTVESLTAHSGGSGVEVDTNAEGSFELGGLFDRAYVVSAYDRETLLRIDSAPIRAGTRDAELILPADALVEHVAGRLTAPDGSPIPGARVSLLLLIAREGGSSSWVGGAAATSSPDGTFEFTKVPSRHVDLSVDGEGVIPTTIPLEGVDLSRPVHAQVLRRCHFRVEGLPPGKDQRYLSVIGSDDQERTIWKFEARGWSSSTLQLVTSDASRVYAVGEDAVELRVVRGNDVLGKRPLQLVPGEVTVVRW